jgi:hypothetical protein
MNLRLKLSVLALLVFLNINALACEVCGTFMGIIPNEKKSFISVFYRYRAFKQDNFNGNVYFPDNSLRTMQPTHGAHTVDGSGYEIYRTVDIRGRYFLHNRIELNVILPYCFNKEFSSGVLEEAVGIGDLTTLLSYHAYESVENKVKHRIQFGAGMKWATGAHSEKLGSERISLLLQPGSGSDDILLNGAYFVGYNKWSGGLNVTQKINGVNKFREKIGNSTTMNGSIFYRLQLNDEIEILPSVQGYFEKTKGLYINNDLQSKTGMQVLMGGFGIDINIKNVALNSAVQIPIDEPKSINSSEGTVRIILGCTLNFDQKAFIFKQKTK